MTDPRPLNIPVILGTSRKGRASGHAAKLLADLLNRRAGCGAQQATLAPAPVSELP
jgi:NAD(P)H-dependent FMN reductase